MKIIGYVGIEESVIVIEKSTDLYPALDYIQTKMIELSERGDKKAEDCANFIASLMEQTEKAEFGSMDNVNEIKWT